MNYNWTNNAYWLLRLRLKPGAKAPARLPAGAGFSRTACRRLPAGRLLAEQAVQRADWWA